MTNNSSGKPKERAFTRGPRINGGPCKELREAIRTAENPAAVHAALEAWETGQN